MRVAFNVEQLLQQPPGGIGRYAAELVRLLPTLAAPEGDDEGVVVLPFTARHSPSALAAVQHTWDLPTVPVALNLPRSLLYEVWNRWGRGDPTRSLALRDVDLVHAPSLAVPGTRRVPLVVTVHDAAPILFPDAFSSRGRTFHRNGFAAVASRAAAVVAPSAAAADEIAASTKISRGRITVIHHGVDQDQLDDDAAAEMVDALGLGDAPYVLWVGSLEPRKNVPVLVDAFTRLVAPRDLPHRLVLVGPNGWLGVAEQVRSGAAALGDRVRLTGPMTQAHLAALYRRASLFAFPSLHEGFGMPVIEAMAQGTAVVASDLPVLREVAGDAARFVEASSAEAWADAMGALLRDDAARAALGAAGREWVRRYTWARSAQAHLDVYRSVL